ncbi:unnamed protein product [Euphydryas editha]|uniref:Uncharacterized protein n=1 Tax=Euphydryas editha TaxID=104508 RepID=A0AAU9TMX2_EUPED|nr:unnamed protein product [Euphydryas editha]
MVKKHPKKIRKVSVNNKSKRPFPQEIRYPVTQASTNSISREFGEGEPGGERRRCAGAGGVSRGMRRRPLLLLLLLALLRAHGLLAASGGTISTQTNT